MTISFADELADPEAYLPAAPQARKAAPARYETTATGIRQSSQQVGGNVQQRVDEVISYVQSRGFVFQPWQVAAFITAVRTKPFVILAGISGTGKTKLPKIVADATSATCITVAVRPDWTDSSDLLGFERLEGSFRPGELLRAAKQAQGNAEKQFFFVLDEMNIARVEYYLAEVLSHIEQFRPFEEGRMMSEPLVPHVGGAEGGEEWQDVRLPENLCIVGSVNMDETTYGFSKKVLDRAFVIEFSSVDLSEIGEISERHPAQWPFEFWRPSALSLSGHPNRDSEEVGHIIETLTEINSILAQGQLQFGYRVRDEIAMFCLAAQQCADAFTTSEAGTVDPLDLAIAMKVLPRIQGGGETIRKVLAELQAWATPTSGAGPGQEAGIEEKPGFPFCAARVDLMLRRWHEGGFANYWL
jgi:5-methylcytosine-specific restriction endonuclease McrBC GTP-binding regulatory subunit McrB